MLESRNIRDKSNNDMVERLHGTIRQRNKVMRGLDDEATAQTMMDGSQVYYNFLRPRMALNGKTSTQKAKLVSDTENVICVSDQESDKNNEV